MTKKAKQSILKEFPVYHMITIFAVVLASFYAIFLLAMETYAAK